MIGYLDDSGTRRSRGGLPGLERGLSEFSCKYNLIHWEFLKEGYHQNVSFFNSGLLLRSLHGL